MGGMMSADETEYDLLSHGQNDEKTILTLIKNFNEKHK